MKKQILFLTCAMLVPLFSTVPARADGDLVVRRVSTAGLEGMLRILDLPFEEIDNNTYKIALGGLNVVVTNGNGDIGLFAGFVSHDGVTLSHQRMEPKRALLPRLRHKERRCRPGSGPRPREAGRRGWDDPPRQRLRF